MFDEERAVIVHRKYEINKNDRQNCAGQTLNALGLLNIFCHISCCFFFLFILPGGTKKHLKD